ncbi:MAG TPA: hypothetical protein PLL71_16015 [Agriterribacter sp.]|nr:hypothetical protein [Agriterribacter sp.]HRQ51131.1 hypothetical protein [Agriterribacter sp.]
MLRLAPGSREISDRKEVKRANMIRFYERTEQLAGANHMLFLKVSNTTWAYARLCLQ